MALVIAANTTIFSLLNATVLRRVHAPDPDSLIVISSTDTRTGAPGLLYADTLAAFGARQRSFASLALHSNAFYRCEYDKQSFDVFVEGVTPEYFQILGAGLTAGRLLSRADESAAGEIPAVIGHRLWQRVFGSDAGAIGRTFRINDVTATVVGVLEPGFEGFMIDGGTEIFLPHAVNRRLLLDRKGPERGRFVIARLAPGVSLTEARAEVLATWPAIAEAAPSLPPPEQAAVAAQRLAIESGANGFSVMAREWGPSFLVVLGLTAILLGVAAVNMMGLMSSRILARRNEIAICLALGASHGRMLRRLVIDGLLLASLALALAVPLAWWMSEVLEGMLTISRVTPLLKPMTPDARVLAVSIAIALGMGIAVGLLPAIGAVRGSRLEGVRSGRGIAPSLGRSGRLVLVIQVALSMVLLVGAGLFAGMLVNLHRHDASFRGREVMWTRLTRVPGARTPLGSEYYRLLVDRLNAIPGATGAVLNFYFPAFLGFRGGFPVDRYTPVESPDATPLTGLTEIVTPGFFDFFGIARVTGRDFSWDDDGSRPGVAIVSQSLARGLFGDADAVGRRVRVQAGSSAADLEIVGVVADAPIGSIREPRRPVLFRPLLQDLPRAQTAMAHVSVRRNAGSIRAGYVTAVESQGQHYVRGLFTLEQWLDNALLQERLIAGVSTFAALMALLLACLGVYGALAYAVVSRVREIGLRMALGASRETVVRMVVREGLAVIVPGVLAGIPISVGAALLVRAQLYGVSPADPTTILAAALIFVVTGAIAAWLPARRASSIEPSEALRQE